MILHLYRLHTYMSRLVERKIDINRTFEQRELAKSILEISKTENSEARIEREDKKTNQTNNHTKFEH